tara:strand:+ start:2040 stop:2849 length:810 start_codon:yes stop_codon:yes gene_type:complete
MSFKEKLNNYNECGYLYMNCFEKDSTIHKINSLIDSLEPKVFIPYSENIPWGYGNLINCKELIQIINLKEIMGRVANYLTQGNLVCNHLVIANKAAFIGPDVEWHQEFSNINSFAPGYSPSKDLGKFAQLYIAIDEHTYENGTLYVFEGSHKEGLLPTEDIINNHLNHKRRIKFNSIKEVSDKYKQKAIILKPGEAILFNHLLVHGSPTNCSPYRRRAMLLQFRISDKIKDEALFNKEVEKRKQFVLNQLEIKKNKLLNSEIYKDFGKN